MTSVARHSLFVVTNKSRFPRFARMTSSGVFHQPTKLILPDGERRYPREARL